MQGIRHTYGGQARIEPHKILPVVSSDIDILVVYGDEKPHEKHSKEHRQFLPEIGLEAFKRPLLTHRNAITTGWKTVGRCLEIIPKRGN